MSLIRLSHAFLANNQMDRKINKDTEYLNMINKIKPKMTFTIDHNTHYTQKTQKVFFLNTHGTFTKIHHKSSHRKLL